MTTALFPGTFDPVTNGHLELVRRGAVLFSRVIVGVGARAGKTPLFERDDRVRLFREAVAGIEGVDVQPFDGLVVNFARHVRATVLIRGTRTTGDFEYELQMAQTNRHLAAEIETVFLAPSPELGMVSSTLVREIVLAGGDVDAFVPPPVVAALRARP